MPLASRLTHEERSEIEELIKNSTITAVVSDMTCRRRMLCGGYSTFSTKPSRSSKSMRRRADFVQSVSDSSEAVYD